MKRKILLVLMLATFGLSVNAQQCLTGGCSNFVNNYPAGTFSTTSSVWAYPDPAHYNMNAGNYTLFSVTNGNTYEWSYCESFWGLSTSWDAQITLFDYNNPPNAYYLCYSNDYCGDYGNAPYISWTATFTGTVLLLTSEYPCVSNTPDPPYNRLVWRMLASGPSCTNWSVNPSTQSVPATGGSYSATIYVTGTGTCTYSLTFSDSWIVFDSYGINGVFNYHVNNNTGGARTGEIDINDVTDGINNVATLTINQAGISCTSPSASVNSPSGTSPLTITCNASGGSGGSIAYKWYSGSSCSGSVLGTGSTLSVTSSGNYACKAYITNYESTCYSCDYGYATINPNCTSPSSSVNSPTGTSPLTITCTASGGSGGSIAYRWYSGSSCSGTVLGTNSTLSVSSSGYYSCKAYITGYESTCFSCGSGYATINSSAPSITVTSPNGGENWLSGSTHSITSNISGSITGQQIDYSLDGGNTWIFEWGICSLSPVLNYSWLLPSSASTNCKVKVTVFYSGGSVSDVSNATFTISAPGGGQSFELESNLSHLFWPFYNPNDVGAPNSFSDWAGHPGNGWISGTEDGPTSGGNGHNEGGHQGAEALADDWNGPLDCNKYFYSPLEGDVIYIRTDCNPTCVSAFSSCYGYNPPYPYHNSYGNQVIIQSSINPNYAFRVSHLNQVNITLPLPVHVNVGDKLGTIGSSGASTAAHAHCALYKRINETDLTILGATGLSRLLVGDNLCNNVSNTNSKYKADFLFDAVTMVGSGGTSSDSSWAIITASGSTTLCNGDSVLLTANAGTAYFWSTGDTTQSIYVSANGTYYVAVNDSFGDTHISIATYVNVFDPPLAMISTINGNPSFCQGDTLTLFANPDFLVPDVVVGGTDMTFLWSNGTTDYRTTVCSPGTYSVTITNICGSATDQIVISENPVPSQPTIQVNGTALACSTSNGVTYQWNLNGNPISGATSQFHIADSTGYYSVTVFLISTGCFSTSDPVYVVSGIENYSHSDYVNIYPNPTNDFINVEVMNGLKNEELTFSLFNIFGQLVSQERISSSLSTFPVQFLPSGCYIYKIINDEKVNIETGKIIKY